MSEFGSYPEKKDSYLPLRLTVDLSEGWDTESWAESVVKALKDKNIFHEDLLFCGYDGKRELMLGKFYVGGIESLYSDSDNPIEHAYNQKKSSLAVIDLKCIDKTRDDVGTDVQFQIDVSDRRALVAIIELKF